MKYFADVDFLRTCNNVVLHPDGVTSSLESYHHNSWAENILKICQHQRIVGAWGLACPGKRRPRHGKMKEGDSLRGHLELKERSKRSRATPLWLVALPIFIELCVILQTQVVFQKALK